MTDAPRYFQPLELPHYCYIWDAIMWVGFGRFPNDTEYLVTDGFPPEFEGYGWKIGTLSFAYKDQVLRQEYRFDGFREHEAAAAGLPDDAVDWLRYRTAMQYFGYIRRETLDEEISRCKSLPSRSPEAQAFSSALDKLTSTYRDPEDDDTRELFDAAYVASLERRREITPFIDDVHRLFQHHIDRAWVKLFSALVDGKFQGYGWRELRQDEIRDAASEIHEDHYLGQPVHNPYRRQMPARDLIGPLESLACLDVIPASEYSLSGVAPDSYYRSANGQLWRDVIFPTDAIFDLFPTPMLTLKPDITAHIALLTPDVAVSTPAGEGEAFASLPAPTDRRAGPGKRKKLDGTLERACHLLYGKRMLAGEKEAGLLAEAQSLAKAVWGETLGRTTFQDYMKSFKADVPDIVPDMAAE